MKIRKGDIEITFKDVEELKQVVDEGLFDIMWSAMLDATDDLWGESEYNQDGWFFAMSEGMESLEENDPEITYIELTPEQEDEVIQLLVDSKVLGENVSLEEESTNPDGTVNFILSSDELPDMDGASNDEAADMLLHWLGSISEQKSYKKNGLTDGGKLDGHALLQGDEATSIEAEEAITEQDTQVMELWKRLK